MAGLSVIVPTFNERDNVTELVKRLHACLDGVDWEVIFVDDDSPDETASVVRSIARNDARVRCLQRIGRRGLSSACVEGMLASAAPYLAVMDADMQHDERLLPEMLAVIAGGGVDVVIGSRYAAGGGVGDWDGGRQRLSRLATRLSRLAMPAGVADPMSGFFMIRREVLEGAVRNLSSIGFKVLLDFFASSPAPLRYKELPYQFRARRAGESKLDNQAAWDFLMLLADKWVGRFVPVRFIAFATVGGLGVFVHLATVAVVYGGIGASFVTSQTLATLVAMVSNFTLDNELTYRDKRLRGWRWLYGLAAFAITCSIGAVANVGVAAYLFGQHSGWVLAAIGGVVVGAAWNYAVTAVYTWGKPRAA